MASQSRIYTGAIMAFALAGLAVFGALPSQAATISTPTANAAVGTNFITSTITFEQDDLFPTTTLQLILVCTAGVHISNFNMDGTAIAGNTFTTGNAVVTGTLTAHGFGYGYGVLGGKQTGFGYTTGGYGLSTGYTGFVSGGGNGYGHGYVASAAGQDLTYKFQLNRLAFQINESCTAVLGLQTTLSGSFQSARSSSFVVRPAGGGGGGGGGVGGGGNGGDGGSSNPNSVTVAATSTTTPAGATAAYSASIGTVQENQQVVVTTDNPTVPSVSLNFKGVQTNVQVSIVVWPGDSPPPGTPAPPPGFTVASYVEVTTTTADGTVQKVVFAVVLKPGQVPDATKAVLLHADHKGKWNFMAHVKMDKKANGDFTGNFEGNVCCSSFAIGFDLKAPTLAAAALEPTVSGEVRLKADAADNIQMDSVELFIDGTFVGKSTVAPYEFVVDTTKFADGPHTLKFVARDVVGNEAESQRTTTFANSSPTAVVPGGFGTGLMLIIAGILAAIIVVAVIIVRKRRA